MVATVTRLSEAASTVHYFETDGYYAKNDKEHRKASRWHGKGVAALGLHGPVKPRRFEAILSGRIPGTTTRLGRLRDGKHEHRPGLDITFSAPKSVSLEALVHAAPKASGPDHPRPRRGGDGDPRLHRERVAGDPGLGPRHPQASPHQGRRPGGGHLPPHRQPQPRSPAPHPQRRRQHDAQSGRRVAERRLHQDRARQAPDRRPLPRRTQAPPGGPGLRHGADHGGKRARFRDRRATTRRLSGPSRPAGRRRLPG